MYQQTLPTLTFQEPFRTACGISISLVHNQDRIEIRPKLRWKPRLPHRRYEHVFIRCDKLVGMPPEAADLSLFKGCQGRQMVATSDLFQSAQYICIGRLD